MTKAKIRTLNNQKQETTGVTERNSISKDIDLILWSANLTVIRRYYDMRFWEQETEEERRIASANNGLRLESVADHSWHLCDSILLLAPRFPELNIEKCLKLAVLHDKLEIIIGDISPMGKSGTGADGTAYNAGLLDAKKRAEIRALEDYLSMLPETISVEQEKLLRDYLNESGVEAHFVKAVDRLQVYAWLIRKKHGDMTNQHITFSLRYLRKGICKFPSLLVYCDEFEDRLLDLVARKRQTSRAKLDAEIGITAIRENSNR